MSIDLPTSVEQELRALAGTQGREVAAVVEEAIRQYLAAARLSDVTVEEVAEAQTALLPELAASPDWQVGGG